MLLSCSMLACAGRCWPGLLAYGVLCMACVWLPFGLVAARARCFLHVSPALLSGSAAPRSSQEPHRRAPAQPPPKKVFFWRGCAGRAPAQPPSKKVFFRRGCAEELSGAAGAPRSLQELPGEPPESLLRASWSSQELPGELRHNPPPRKSIFLGGGCAEELSGAARSSQEPPGAPRRAS